MNKLIIVLGGLVVAAGVYLVVAPSSTPGASTGSSPQTVSKRTPAPEPRTSTRAAARDVAEPIAPAPAPVENPTSTGKVAVDFIPRSPGTPEPLAGLEMRSLDDSDRAKLNFPERYKGGVFVGKVDPRSPGAEASIKPGDVIIQAQLTKVQSPDELIAAVGDREHTMLVVVRDGHPFNVTVHKAFRPTNAGQK